MHLIFDLYDQGYLYGEIQKQLNALGYKTKAGNPFGKNSLHDILRRECYTGTYVYNKTQQRRVDGSRSNRPKPESEIIRVENAIPAIVDKAVWQRVQQRMDENRKHGGREKAKELYLLSGLVFCGLCGHRYVGNGRYPGKDREKFVSYACNYRHSAHACTNREIKRDVLEGYVLDLIQTHILNESVIPELTQSLNTYFLQAHPNTAKERRQYQLRLAELEREKTNLIDAIAKTGYNEMFTERLEKLREEESTLTSMLDRLNSSAKAPQVTEELVRGYFHQFQSCIKERNIPQIRRFLRSYVKRVEVYPDTVKVYFQMAMPADQGFPADSCYEFQQTAARQNLKLA